MIPKPKSDTRHIDATFVPTLSGPGTGQETQTASPRTPFDLLATREAERLGVVVSERAATERGVRLLDRDSLAAVIDSENLSLPTPTQ